MIATLVCTALLGSTPDFAGVIHTPKLNKAIGERKVMFVLWDPQRPTDPAPTRGQIEGMLFGPNQSVEGWFWENSRGKLRLKSAGVFGWYRADKPAEHYWGPSDAADADKDGFTDGHVEKWTEAIRKADREFDFQAHDANKNGTLEPLELSVLIVVPQNVPFGTARVPAGRQFPAWEPLKVDGVSIPVITEVYAGRPVNLGLFAHELCHQILGAPDMYVDTPFRPGLFSLMDCSYYTVHLDPFEKLKLGWLQPMVVDKSGTYELRDIESSGQALVIYRPDRGTGEYFIVENRRRHNSYDVGLPGDGLVAWHVIEDPNVYSAFPNIQAIPGDWGRRSLRLLRPGTGLGEESHVLMGKGDVCRPNWADGSPSGIEIRSESAPGQKMSVGVTVGR